MKNSYIFIILFGLFAFSCDKDTPSEDVIIYKDISPDKEIRSVRFFTLEVYPPCEVNVPTPIDSTVYYYLDLNNDQISDFKISVGHSKYTGDQYCGHCSVFTYYISIDGLLGSNLIAKSPSLQWVPKFFNESEVIDENNTWDKKATILLLKGCDLPFQADFVDSYIGVRINNSYGYIHIDRLTDYGIRILEHGFNKTENNIIKCGDK